MSSEDQIANPITHFRCNTHDAGPFFIEDSTKSSGKILDFHKKLNCSIEYLTKEQASQTTSQKPNSLQSIVGLVLDSANQVEQKESRKDILAEICSLISKTVKGDRNLVYQILFCGLSAFTSNPIHLMIMEKSSEGKTYPALQIAQHFPKDNLMILGSATPQSFKYEHGTLVDKEYRPIQDRVDELEEQIETSSKSKKNSDDSRPDVGILKQQLKSLKIESKTLIDLRNKWIIFKEPPDHKLLEALYSTLSTDEEYNEHKFVNKSSGGKNQNYTVVFRGCPSILICTSRDESNNSRWLETFSRFHIVSPLSTTTKYSEGMDLIGKACGLPKELFEEFVINEKEKEKIKEITVKLISSIENSNGEIFNPFTDKLSELFPHEVGYRWRQYRRFLTLLELHCLCYSNHRPHLLMNGRNIPVVTKADIESILQIIDDSSTIPPNKIRWFKEIFIACWKKCSETVDFGRNQDVPIDRSIITGNTLVNYTKEQGKGKLTTKQIRETYLDMLFENGIIEKDRDPRNMSRDVYWPTEGYNDTKTSLIATSSLDESCVKSCLEKYLKRRFNFELENKDLTQDEIILYILSTKNVTQNDEFEPKNDNDEATISGVLDKV